MILIKKEKEDEEEEEEDEEEVNVISNIDLFPKVYLLLMFSLNQCQFIF